MENQSSSEISTLVHNDGFDLSDDNASKEKHSFSFIYKLHTKYLQLVKSQFSLYFVNNNVVNARTLYKDKDFQAFKKEVVESQTKIPKIIAVGVNK